MKIILLIFLTALSSCGFHLQMEFAAGRGINDTTMHYEQLHNHYRTMRGKLIGKSDDDPLLASDVTHPLEQHDTLLLRSIGEEASPGTRRKWLKVTTIDPDRSGDIVIPSGGEYDGFRRNPQFLWQHGLTSEAVHTLGRIVRLVITDNAVYALAEYAPEGVSALADKIASLDEAGLVPANSIGFRPIEWKPNDNGGFTFTKWELVEISKVELPANPFASDTQ